MTSRAAISGPSQTSLFARAQFRLVFLYFSVRQPSLLLAERPQVSDESLNLAVLEGLSPRRHISWKVDRRAAFLDRFEHGVVGNLGDRRAIGKIARPRLER